MENGTERLFSWYPPAPLEIDDRAIQTGRMVWKAPSLLGACSCTRVCSLAKHYQNATLILFMMTPLPRGNDMARIRTSCRPRTPLYLCIHLPLCVVQILSSSTGYYSIRAFSHMLIPGESGIPVHIKCYSCTHAKQEHNLPFHGNINNMN